MNTISSIEICLGIIPPNVAGGLDQPYDDDAPLTVIRAEDEEAPYPLHNILSNTALADRVRSLRVAFHRPTLFSVLFGIMIRNALQILPKLEELEIEGCSDNDYGLIGPPTRLPDLITFNCDVQASPQFVHFLEENPTIINLFYEGVDTGGYLSGLSQWALPRLAHIQCDIALLPYFLIGRPVSSVIPYNYHSLCSFDFCLQSMRESTADGGIAEGGGVTRFRLGALYSLEQLAHAAPNLQQLHLEEEEHMGGDVAARRFWTATDWDCGLVLFERLRKIIVLSMEEITYEDQRSLVNRWSTSSVRPETLTRITFKHGLPHPRLCQPTSTLVEYIDGDNNANTIPGLVYDDSMAVESDETPSLDSGDDMSSDSSDGSGYSGRSRTRWWWDQEAGEWRSV